jgi:hypothetical protein
MENNILKMLADNPALLTETRKVITNEFADSSLELNLTNEQLGERTRARMTGLEAVDRAFKKILLYQTVEPRPMGVNRAR